MDKDETKQRGLPPPPEQTAPPQPIDARRLLGARREAVLLLDGEAYRLRITANQKLILTK
jgi:hemin uptake protein HemP